MKTYRYVFGETSYYEVFVEAESPEQAFDFACEDYGNTGGDEIDDWHETFVAVDGDVMF